MIDVQRFRQSTYDGELTPSDDVKDAHYMFYKDYQVVVSLMREALTKADNENIRLQGTI